MTPRGARPDGLSLPRRSAPDELVVGGWNITGDTNTMDDAGYLWYQARIAPYQYPRLIEFGRDLPRTATGKLQRFKLRDDGAATR